MIRTFFVDKRMKRVNRQLRTRKRILSEKPRLSVFRSNKYLYAQIIDDKKSHTIAQASTKQLPNKEKGSKLELSKKVGLKLAQEALKKNVKHVVFDRGGYRYHGHVKAIADGAREGGLVF